MRFINYGDTLNVARLGNLITKLEDSKFYKSYKED